MIVYGDILKRKLALQAASDNPVADKNCELYYNRLMESGSVNDVLKLATECKKSSKSAYIYLTDLLPFYEKYSDRNEVSYCIESMVSVVSGYSPDMFSNYPKIAKLIKHNNSCDRIIENHTKISEKIDIEKFIKEQTTDNPTLILNKCCEAVSDFKLPLRGKVIVALEEFCIMSQKNNVEYNEAKALDIATKYFLIKENNKVDLYRLNNAISKNVVINEEFMSINDTDPVDYFKVAPYKNKELLAKTFDDIVSTGKSFKIRNVLDLFEEILCASDDEHLCSSIYNEIMPTLSTKLIDSSTPENEKYLVGSVKELLNDKITACNAYIKRYDNDDISTRFVYYLKSIKDELEKLEEIDLTIYSKYNIECMQTTVQENKLKDAKNRALNFLQDEYDRVNLRKKTKKPDHKCRNFLDAIVKVDRYLSSKFKAANVAIKSKIKAWKEKIFESTDIINIDGSFDTIVDTIIFENEDQFNLEFQRASEDCRYINDNILVGTPYTCYFLATNNIIEFHIKDDTESYIVTEQDIEDHYSILCENDTEYITEIFRAEYRYGFDIPTMQDIEYFLKENDDPAIVTEIFKLIQETGMDEDNVKYLYEAVIPYSGSTYELNQLVNNYNQKDFNLDALISLSSIMYEGKVDDNKNKKLRVWKEPSEEERKKPITGINLNNITLALQGLKNTAKNASAKEQELSRNADMAFNGFVRACKNLLVSDRREAIIKGSVIPSFSRCIKIGIALIAVGYITGGPAIPAIIAIGGIAMSKKLTQKERVLLLDEIETELEVVDREISLAESRNQMKKFRALLKYKKNLQRQYQRIKFNIRVGKDLLPSDQGIPTRED